LQADVNLQEFMDLLLDETATFEEHKKVTTVDSI